MKNILAFLLTFFGALTCVFSGSKLADLEAKQAKGVSAEATAAVNGKLATERSPRFSVLSSNGDLIALVRLQAAAQGFSVRTEKVVVSGREFVCLYCTR